MKKGFIFLETLVVLTVLSISIVSIYSMYIKVSTDIEYRRYYDNISDLYKTDIIRNMINKNTINNDDLISITKDNCTSYMNDTCSSYMTTLGIENIYINNISANSLIYSDNINIKNSLKEYLKTINEENKRYIIINYSIENKNYYASLKI